MRFAAISFIISNIRMNIHVSCHMFYPKLYLMGWVAERQGFSWLPKWSCRRPQMLVDLFGFAGHVVHEEVLAEGVGRGEVGFAAAHLGDFLDELDERIVAGEHEGVNHDAGALAFVDFFESLADDEGIE